MPQITPQDWSALAEITLRHARVMVFWVLPTGYLGYVNEAACQALGYTAEELLQLRASEILADYDVEQRVALRGEFRPEGVTVVRAHLLRKDGTTFPVESENRLVTLPDGRAVNCSFSRDISRQQEIEQRLLHDIELLRAANDQLRQNYDAVDQLRIIGSSRQMREVLRRAGQASASEAPVVIRGETGVGKESLARYVHLHSRRAEALMVTVNCANFTGDDVRSQLFGHRKGAYTGALTERKGAFATADGGTLFLDEVGELPVDAQRQLLRTLQDGSYIRMGEDSARRANVRVIAATNRNLEEMVRSGEFREDLYHRLVVLRLELPPLRERRNDIPELVDYKLLLINRQTGRELDRPDAAGMRLLMEYPFPGNIRELFNVIERAHAHSTGDRLVIAPEFFNTALRPPTELLEDGFVSFNELQRRYILRALEHCNWKISGAGGAAELLGLEASTLRGKMRKLTISRTSSI